MFLSLTSHGMNTEEKMQRMQKGEKLSNRISNLTANKQINESQMTSKAISQKDEECVGFHENRFLVQHALPFKQVSII